jgi:hypothetical protein
VAAFCFTRLAIDSNRRTIWIADAHRGDEKRFIVRSDEKLSAFVELGTRGANRDVLSRIHSSRFMSVTLVVVHRSGKRFIVRADEKLTAFVELERAKPV